MTPHDHREYVDGCYRCEIGCDELGTCEECGGDGCESCRCERCLQALEGGECPACGDVDE